ncbi:HAD family phosphatase [Betaproteobacteria bacterium]|nr:HAD family phosphatase [Betaproteobacteria bacterium]
MQVQAILFDFDGTLADTMHNHFLCWKQSLEEIGVTLNERDYYPLEGASLGKIAEKFVGSREEKIIEKIVKRKKQLYVAMHKNTPVSFYPGVLELIQFLTSKYPLAIVTAGHEDQLKKTVPKEFLALFKCLVCGDAVEKNKPSPEPYLKACEQLKMDPKACVVIENAPLGITSAKKAGCYCIGIKSTCEENQLLEADETITKITQLLTAKVFIN